MTRQAASCGSLPGRKRENTRRRGLMGGRQPSRFPVRKGKTQTGRQAAQGAAAQHGEEGVPSPAEEREPRHAQNKEGMDGHRPLLRVPPESRKGAGNTARDGDHGIAAFTHRSIFPFRKNAPEPKGSGAFENAVPP